MNKKLLTQQEKEWEIINWFIEKVEKLELAYNVEIRYNIDNITNKPKQKNANKKR